MEVLSSDTTIRHRIVGALAGILGETVQRTVPVATSSARSSFDAVVTKRCDPSSATTGGATASRGATTGRGATRFGDVVGATVTGAPVQAAAAKMSASDSADVVCMRFVQRRQRMVP